MKYTCSVQYYLEQSEAKLSQIFVELYRRQQALHNRCSFKSYHRSMVTNSSVAMIGVVRSCSGVLARLATVHRNFSATNHYSDLIIKGNAPKSFMDTEKDIASRQLEVKRLYTSGDFVAALEKALDCRKLVKGHFGEQHPVYASSLNNIAIMYKSLGENDDALDAYRMALHTYEEVVGKEHPSYITTLNNIGHLLKNMAEQAKGVEKVQHLKEAQFALEETLSRRKQALKEGHPDVAIAASSLGGVFRLQGQLERAEELLEPAATALEHALGGEHVAVATALNNLALLRKQQGLFDDARVLYTRALKARESCLGMKHPETITVMHNLAELHLVNGDHSAARALQEKILEMFPEHGNEASIDPDTEDSLLGVRGYEQQLPWERKPGLIDDTWKLKLGKNRLRGEDKRSLGPRGDLGIPRGSS